MASDLGLHCLPITHKKDAMLKWDKAIVPLFSFPSKHSTRATFCSIGLVVLYGLSSFGRIHYYMIGLMLVQH